MNLSTLLIMPLVMMADNYNVVITHTNGTTTEIPTEEVSSIEFKSTEVNPPVVEDKKLDKMTIVTTEQSANSFHFNWSKVENAEYYRWITDGDKSKQLTTSTLQCGVADLLVGDHTVTFTAVPAANSGYLESDPVDVKVTASLIIRLASSDVTKDSFKASVQANINDKVTVGIVPASVTSTAEQIKYVNENAAAQRHEYTSVNPNAESVSFSGLTENTAYNVVAFVSGATDKAFTLNVATKKDLKPGDTDTVYPPGVSATSGWYDVDKVGELGAYDWTGIDNKMCWACAISGMVQWWLDDYKTKTGKDFQTAYPIPTESKCYSTPIMDLYVDYYPHAGGHMFKPLKWFFRPVEYNESWSTAELGDVKMLDESKPNWKGGFGGMTEEQAQALMVVNEQSSNGYQIPEYDFNRNYDVKGKTTAETTKIFSERIIEALRQGPVALSLVQGQQNGSVHGVSCWGAEYKILSDGTPQVTTLYFSENDPISGNKKNQLNTITVTINGDSVQGTPDSTGTVKYLNMFFGLRGYQGK